MAIPEFIRALRDKIGTDPLWLSAVTAVVLRPGEVLLVQRADTREWTPVTGIIDPGEEPADAAARETLEEAGARIELGPLFSLIDVPHVEQAHLFYRARLLHLDFEPGPESLEAKLFTEAEIPWDDIAFRTVGQTLRWFFEDRRAGAYDLHTGAIRYTPRPAA